MTSAMRYRLLLVMYVAYHMTSPPKFGGEGVLNMCIILY
jgi:hypothetical protein